MTTATTLNNTSNLITQNTVNQKKVVESDATALFKEVLSVKRVFTEYDVYTAKGDLDLNFMNGNSFSTFPSYIRVKGNLTFSNFDDFDKLPWTSPVLEVDKDLIFRNVNFGSTFPFIVNVRGTLEIEDCVGISFLKTFSIAAAQFDKSCNDFSDEESKQISKHLREQSNRQQGRIDFTLANWVNRKNKE
ncbi:MAG: hypothetical protein JSR58_02750 [Verrucomicrobia bacterium]|nr:hypothetical protein [Verrucomicrobiota bacterium]